ISQSHTHTFAHTHRHTHTHTPHLHHNTFRAIQLENYISSAWPTEGILPACRHWQNEERGDDCTECNSRMCVCEGVLVAKSLQVSVCVCVCVYVCVCVCVCMCVCVCLISHDFWGPDSGDDSSSVYGWMMQWMQCREPL